VEAGLGDHAHRQLALGGVGLLLQEGVDAEGVEAGVLVGGRGRGVGVGGTVSSTGMVSIGTLRSTYWEATQPS
jgi:hypothetical protein